MIKYFFIDYKACNSEINIYRFYLYFKIVNKNIDKIIKNYKIYKDLNY